MLDKIKYIIGTIFSRGINSLGVCNGESPFSEKNSDARRS